MEYVPRVYRGGYAPVDIGSKMSFRRVYTGARYTDSTFTSHTIIVQHRILFSLSILYSFVLSSFSRYASFNDYRRDKR